jgi:cation transport ATPase
VAKPEDKSPDFEEPILSDATLTPVEPIAEAETPTAETAPTESKPEEIKSEEAEPEKLESTDAKTEKSKKKKKSERAVKEDSEEQRALKKKAAMRYLTLSGLIGIPLIFIALAHFEVLGYPIAVALCGAVLMPWLWLSRKTNTVFTAFLGLTVVALLAAICFLWTELARYNYDIRANQAKQRTAASAPLGRVAAEQYV